MSHEGLHEPPELLSGETRNLHRALISLIEELEAIDWYQQRADACTDQALKAVLLHNRNEEVEHGMMTLEWLRRHDATFDKFMQRYLFKDADIIAIEEAADEAECAEEEGGNNAGDRVGERGVSLREPIAGGSEPSQGSENKDGSLGIRSLRGG
jgi:uncharacterized protein